MAELRQAVVSLTDIARVLRRRRTEQGAVELDSVEVKVQMSEDKDTTKIENLIPKQVRYECSERVKLRMTSLTHTQPLEVHETIAECMIFANHWVAKKIHSALPTSSLLRRHPPPSQDRFSHLRICARARGFQISTGTNKDLAGSLNKAEDSRDPEVNKVSLVASVVLLELRSTLSSLLDSSQPGHPGHVPG